MSTPRKALILDADLNVYHSNWEKKYEWLGPSDQGKDHFYCNVCRKDYFGGLRQITVHCTTPTHMKALVAAVDGSARPAPSEEPPPKNPSHRKRNLPVEPKQGTSSKEPKAVETKTEPQTSSNFITLKTYMSPVDGKRIVLGMERRLEPFIKTKDKKVRRQVVAPYSRSSETRAAVKTIEQAESGLLIEEPSPVHPVSPLVKIKGEPNASPADQRLSAPLIETDAFDVFGKHVSNKLRSLPPEQNKFAQKLIMDVLFEGEMESLDRNTKVVKCGVSCVCQQ